jgi:hypothetical protein
MLKSSLFYKNQIRKSLIKRNFSLGTLAKAFSESNKSLLVFQNQILSLLNRVFSENLLQILILLLQPNKKVIVYSLKQLKTFLIQ